MRVLTAGLLRLLKGQMKNGLKKIVVLAGVVVTSVIAPAVCQAQITNTPAGVQSAIVTGISPVFDAAVTVGIGAIAVGFAIMYVRKGLGTRH